MTIEKTKNSNGVVTKVVDTMESFLTFRTTETPTLPAEQYVKHKPLLNREIDANFLSVKKELERKAPINNPVFTGNVEFSSTSALLIPKGTTAQRPTVPSGKDDEYTGYLRYNTELHQFEGYEETVLSIDEDGDENIMYAWQKIGGGATGGGTDKIFYLSEQEMTYDYTIPQGYNAMVPGDLTIGDGLTLTIQDGTRLVIV